MKFIHLTLLLFIAGAASAQSKQETQILALSNTIFKWEIANQVDSLTDVFDQKLMVVNSNGEIRKKGEFIAALSSGTFVHNDIAVEENIATIENNTAVVVGKGKFTVTISGNKLSLHLSYMEVFTRINNRWKLLALHFGVLAN